MLRDWGTWELADVLAYAIGYAAHGVPLVPRVPATIESVRPLFEAEWPSSAAVFLPGGQVARVGRAVPQRGLAATYERLCREAVGAAREARIEAARRAWYRGLRRRGGRPVLRAEPRCWTPPAAAIAACSTADDFADWQPTVEDPVAYDYHGHTVLKCGPWSQGPVFLQQLALLQGFDIGAMDPVGRRVRPHRRRMRQARLRRSRGVLRRRAGRAARPRCSRPTTTTRAASWSARRPRSSCGPATVAGHTPWVDHDAASRSELLTRAAGAGEPTVARLGVIGADTVHIDVIDRWGNMVSATPSGGWLQSSPVVPGLGFPMGTRGQMFWLQPGLPN